jgi:transcriptional regulator
MKFAPRSGTDITALIDAHPLCWVMSHDAGGFGATPLPLLAETDGKGSLVALFGHFARANPQVEQLRASPRAVVLVNGPHTYISPNLVSQPDWVPTWNYTTAKIDVEIEFVADETLESIERLTDRMEAGQTTPWQVANAGARLEPMLGHIIAFRAHVVAIQGRFKLGQDEGATALREIVAGVENRAVADWMTLYNAERLPVEDGAGSAITGGVG